MEREPPRRAREEGRGRGREPRGRKRDRQSRIGIRIRTDTRAADSLASPSGTTHLLAVAKLDVPLDNATVIHHCGGLAPSPRRFVTALSLPRSIAPYDRAPAARHHSPGPAPSSAARQLGTLGTLGTLGSGTRQPPARATPAVASGLPAPPLRWHAPRDRWTDGNLVAAPLHESRGEIHTANGQPRAPSILTISEHRTAAGIAHQRGRVALAQTPTMPRPMPMTRAAAAAPCRTAAWRKSEREKSGNFERWNWMETT